MKALIFDDEVRWILGRPNFTCRDTAIALRALGQKIPMKAEEEQAATIYWMLTMYEKHGKDWRLKGRMEMAGNLAAVAEKAEAG